MAKQKKGKPVQASGTEKDAIDPRIACTFKVPFEVYRKLQEIRVARRTSLQNLFEEAVEVWLASVSKHKG